MSPVSIVTPAYKAQPWIARPVRSVLAQTHADWEMIIVSDDGLDYEAVLKAQGIKDKRLRFASTGRIGAGPGTARNVGLDAARHDIIAHLDADDAYAPDMLELALPAVKEHGACIGAMRMVDDKGQEIPLEPRPVGNAMLALPQLLRYCLGYATVIIDRQRCDVRWPEGLPYGEDLLFWVCILDKVPAVAYVSDAQFDYYYRGDSHSRPQENSTRGRYERRQPMLSWLDAHQMEAHCPANYDITRQWIISLNAMEEACDHLLEMDAYMHEINQRYDALFNESRH